LCGRTEFDGHLVDYTSIIQRTRAYKDDENCRLEAQIADLNEEELLENIASLKNNANKCLSFQSTRASEILMKSP
jgi:hypothetical protein